MKTTVTPVFPRYATGGHLSLSEIWGAGLTVAGQSTPAYQIVNERSWMGDLQLSYSDGRTQTRTYSYNLTGLMPASENFYYGDISYTYNTDKFLTQIGDLSLTRDNSTGLVTQKSLGSLTEAISYNEFGEVAAREFRYSGNILYKEGYTRDKLGRITNKRVIKNGTLKDLGYEYDIKGRLKKTFENQIMKNSYTYDAQGNRLSKNDNYTASYDGRDRISSFTKDNVQTTYTYSDDGTNIVKAKPGEITTYTVSLLGPLMQVYVQSNDSFAFNYILDGELQRISKEYAFGRGGRSRFSFDKDGRIIGERRQTALVDYTSRFIYATQNHSPDYMLSNWTGQLKKYFFVKDQLGSILEVIDEAGSTVQEIQYDEFGQILSDSNPGLQPFGFAGGHYDPDTGLTRFGARDYNAETGRWLVRDPSLFEGGTTNLYEYVGNDPVNKIDPTGLYEVCTTPLSGFDHEFGPIFHEYLCANGLCGGQTRTGNPFNSPGKNSNDGAPGSTGSTCKKGPKDNEGCMDKCIAAAIGGGRPNYSVINVGGSNCQKWANDVVSSCKAQCGGK